MLRIIVYKPTELVEVRLSGSISPDQVMEGIAAFKRELALSGLRRYGLVLDVTDSPIQSQEMVRVMGEQMVVMPKAQALAIVTVSSLAKMQIRRLFTQPYARIVPTIEDGRAWVLHGTEPLAA